MGVSLRSVLWSPRVGLWFGLGLLGVAALLAPAPGQDSGFGSGSAQALSSGEMNRWKEPLAEALRPLGPVRSIASALLWMEVLQQQKAGQLDAVADVAEGLLAIHPDLSLVRGFLARQVIVTEAPRAPDVRRHRALVGRGLALLEEGLELSDSPRLHATLGQLLAVQSRSDPRFRAVATQYFGEDPQQIAIQELRLSESGTMGRVWLAELLLDRCREAVLRTGDLFRARRDLAEVEDLLGRTPELGRPGTAEDIEQLRELIDTAAAAEGNRS
jgi:hypothetical protein